jgi:Domain of unknown function (DUF397)
MPDRTLRPRRARTGGSTCEAIGWHRLRAHAEGARLPMTRPDPATLDWKKSTFSSSTNNCLEVARAQGSVFIRDSKDRRGPVLVFTDPSWLAFVRGVKTADGIY